MSAAAGAEPSSPLDPDARRDPMAPFPRAANAEPLVQVRDLVKHFPIVQGTVLFAALFIIVANILVDIAYAYLDPRVRYS